jgi:hypothetical protein
MVVESCVACKRKKKRAARRETDQLVASPSPVDTRTSESEVVTGYDVIAGGYDRKVIHSQETIEKWRQPIKRQAIVEELSRSSYIAHDDFFD